MRDETNRRRLTCKVFITCLEEASVSYNREARETLYYLDRGQGGRVTDAAARAPIE